MKAAPIVIAGAALLAGFAVKRFCSSMPVTSTFGHAGTSRKAEPGVDADSGADNDEPGDWFVAAPELAHGEWG